MIEKILYEVEKPGRYAGGEYGIHIKDWTKVKATVALAYPDLYDVGMSYYGFQILYHILNRDSEIAAERVYAPWTDFEENLRLHSIPLFSLESRTPLKQFDVIGFTLPYELTSTNILNMLDLAGIPLLSAERTPEEPIIIAGGGGAYNPEPLAPFIDAFVIGDGEEIIVPLVKFIAEKRRRMARQEMLREALDRYSGIYVPEFYHPKSQLEPYPLYPALPEAPYPIHALRIQDLRSDYYPSCPIIPIVEIAQNRLVAEIMRGCTQGCRFCQAGMIYRPVREREPIDVLAQIDSSLLLTGYDDVSLLSLSSADYTGLYSLANGVLAMQTNHKSAVSFPSLRLDSFREEIAQIASQTRKSGLTFAPEAGSQRLRNVINKRITEDELLRSTEIAIRYGWRVIKLYFMLGLPTETEADLTTIYELSRRVVQAGKGRLTLNITLSTFIPKPFTPFQWEAQDSPDEIQQKLDYIKPRLMSLRHIKVMARDPLFSQIEGIISRGDRQIAEVILSAWENGAKLDSWKEHFSAEIWEKSFKKHNLIPAEYTSVRPIDLPLPWDHIDALVSKEYLIKERDRAYCGETTPDCREVCNSCGVCQQGKIEMKFAESGLPEKMTQPAPITVETPKEKNSVKYRLKFRKMEPVRFSSHLNVLRVFQQSLRRAGLDLVYTEGFNQRPKISSGFPLPLGYTSEEEFIDITLRLEVADIIERLNRNIATGFEIIEAIAIPSHSHSVFSITSGFLYEISVPEEALPSLEKNVNDFLGKKEYIIYLGGEKVKKEVDVRKYVKIITIEGAKLKVKTEIINGRTVKISELIDALNLEKNTCRVRRLRSYLTSNDNNNFG